MKTSAGGTEPLSSAPHDLQGWKEIAAYLGKSVRSAQRWERELGLPVHRLKTADGQVIFARQPEIDAWKAAHTLSSSEFDEQPPVIRERRLGWMALAGGLLVAVTGVIWRVGSPPAENLPIKYLLTDNSLDALDRESHRVWTYPFDLTLLRVRQFPRPTKEQAVAVRDLDGDGEEEILTIITHAPEAGITSDELYCFSNRGRVLWKYTPALSLAFSGRTFDSPWAINSLLITGSGKQHAIWVAVAHNTWWPSALVRLDSGGHAQIKYVQSGSIYALAGRTISGRRKLFAAGINNEYGAASLAELDEDSPPVSSPQTTGSEFRCDNCSPIHPERYFLFPPTDVNRVSSLPYNRAVNLNMMNDTLLVDVEESNDVSAATVRYTVGPNLELAGYEFTDGFWLAHRRYSEENLFHHMPEMCPERRNERVVRVYTPSEGWKTASARAAVSAISGRPSPH